jgi:dihydroxyacetone kinase
MGFSLSCCTDTSESGALLNPEDSETEYGVDIALKADTGHDKLLYTYNFTKRFIDSISTELKLSAGKRVALMINGFGASSLMELYLICNDALRILSNKGCIVTRNFVNNLMTVNNTNVVSISVLKLDDELESLLNTPCETPSFKVNGSVDVIPYRDKFALLYKPDRVDYKVETSTRNSVIGEKLTLDNLIYIIDVISESIIRNEDVFNKLNTSLGDDNFGSCLAKGFKQLKKEWKSILAQPHLSISSFLDACSLIIMDHCGNVSGPIWGSAFRAASRNVIGKKNLTVCDFAQMLKASVKGIYDSGERLLSDDTVIGKKFLFDGLIPYTNTWIINAKKGTDFLRAFKESAGVAASCVSDAEQIAESISRAVKADERDTEAQDIGAYALGVVFTDIANAVK